MCLSHPHLRNTALLWCLGTQIKDSSSFSSPATSRNWIKLFHKEEVAFRVKIIWEYLQDGWGIWCGWIPVISFSWRCVEENYVCLYTDYSSFFLSQTLLCMAWPIWSGKYRPALLLWSAGRSWICCGLFWPSISDGHKACGPEKLPPDP